MLVEEWRPQLYCKGVEVDNLSVDKQVLFIDKDHKYFHEDDITNAGALVPFEESKYQFRSPTGIIADFKEKFDSVKQAKKYVVKHKLDISWQELVHQWDENGKNASEDGTMLHAYSESLWNGWNMPKPDHDKVGKVLNMYKTLSGKYELATTELLVYSKMFRVAGQVDLLLRNKSRSEYYLMDYKFLNKPLDKKSFFNPRTRSYKYMKGPFRKLQDCKHSHYSVQMELYRMLMGKFGKKVKSKTLLVVSPEGIAYEEGIKMIIWVDLRGILQAKYYDWKGNLYNSSKDRVYMKKPYQLI